MQHRRKDVQCSTTQRVRKQTERRNTLPSLYTHVTYRIHIAYISHHTECNTCGDKYEGEIESVHVFLRLSSQWYDPYAAATYPLPPTTDSYHTITYTSVIATMHDAFAEGGYADDG